MSDPKITVKDIDYHRNGVYGQGFFIVLFDDAEHGAMMAIVLDREIEKKLGQAPCFVLNTDMLAKRDIRFFYNSWRGDQYYDVLIEAIDKWQTLSYEEQKEWAKSWQEDK